MGSMPDRDRVRDFFFPVWLPGQLTLVPTTGWGDGVAQLVGRRTRDPKTRARFEPRQEHKKNVR